MRRLAWMGIDKVKRSRRGPQWVRRNPAIVPAWRPSAALCLRDGPRRVHQPDMSERLREIPQERAVARDLLAQESDVVAVTHDTRSNNRLAADGSPPRARHSTSQNVQIVKVPSPPSRPSSRK